MVPILWYFKYWLEMLVNEVGKERGQGEINRSQGAGSRLVLQLAEDLMHIPFCSIPPATQRVWAHYIYTPNSAPCIHRI
jgi:hypothetical protein